MDDGFWTHNRTLTLRRLWARGKSGGLIAKSLKATRGAVLGKLHRLGLLGSMPAEERLRRHARASKAVWARISKRARHARMLKISETRRRNRNLSHSRPADASAPSGHTIAANGDFPCRLSNP